MTIIKDHIALIGDAQHETSKIVMERYKKFVAPYVTGPATFVKVEPVDVEAVTNAERRAQELEIMRSRGEI